jgi:hypothetical protein
MADNELSLKCRVCGETFYIAKRFGLEGYYRNSKLHGDDLLKFLDDHHYSCAVTQDNMDDDIFDVDYEIPPEWLKDRHELAAHYEKKLKTANERIEQLERIVDTYERVQQEFFIDKARKEAE